jgi:fermentation-respiration switch protein FrsA (DUF1100 family)
MPLNDNERTLPKGLPSDWATRMNQAALVTTYTKNTWANDDATPSVAGATYWETGTNTDTVTMLDGGATGQVVYVISRAAITYDVTGTNLKCGSTDIVTAAGDLISWLFDGTNWTCISFHNLNDDYNELQGD